MSVDAPEDGCSTESKYRVRFVGVDALVDGIGGTWSSSCGACFNSSTLQFDPAVAGVGSHTITYSIPGACGGAHTETITVSCPSGKHAKKNNHQWKTIDIGCSSVVRLQLSSRATNYLFSVTDL